MQKPTKKKKNKSKQDLLDKEVDSVNSNNGEINISSRRLGKLKGILKTLLFSHDSLEITKDNIDLDQVTDKEDQVSSLLFTHLKPLIPQQDLRFCISGQLPLIILANMVFEATKYKRHSLKLCPKPSPSSLTCLSIDTALLYSLLTNFGDTNYDLRGRGDE